MVALHFLLSFPNQACCMRSRRRGIDFRKKKKQKKKQEAQEKSQGMLRTVKRRHGLLIPPAALLLAVSSFSMLAQHVAYGERLVRLFHDAAVDGRSTCHDRRGKRSWRPARVPNC